MKPEHCREYIEELEELLEVLNNEGFDNLQVELIDKTIRAVRLLGFILDANKEYGPFICGGSTIEQPDGLPDHIWVCPALGSDLQGLYKKERVSAPEW